MTPFNDPDDVPSPPTLTSTGNSIYTTINVTSQQSNVLPGDYITAFSINPFIAEVGSTVTNPTFSAIYSTAPTAVQIYNTAYPNIATPFSSPFTSGAIMNTFTSMIVNGAVTFTLSAIFPPANNTEVLQQATQNLTFVSRSFGGTGTAGATNATSSSNTAILDTGHGILSSMGLHLTDAGQSYGPFYPQCQYLYLLVPHVTTTYAFVTQDNLLLHMNPPVTISFVNQYGITVSMDLYQSAHMLEKPVTVTLQNPVVYDTSAHQHGCGCHDGHIDSYDS